MQVITHEASRINKRLQDCTYYDVNIIRTQFNYLMLNRVKLCARHTSWCQCFDLGCLQDTLCWGFVMMKVLVIERLW